MSVLTKVFVVLVTVLSILLVALFVPFVAKTENYKEQVRLAKTEAEGARQTAAQRQTEINTMQNKQTEAYVQLQSAKALVDQQVLALNDRLAQSEKEGLEAKADLVKREADLTQLSAAAKLSTQLQEAMEAELRDRRTAMVSQQTRMIELQDRIEEITSQLQAAERQRKRDAERLVDLETQLAETTKRLAQGGSAVAANTAGPTAPATFESSVTINGSVTKVDKVEGDSFAQINVGSAGGVEENMRFLVHRGDVYLGTLVITAVDTNAASGRMTLSTGDIQAGDKVLSGGQ
ncbi:MAG: hypothetical protein IT444_06675 [Phycisphaeraceae bacterium]|nr:hypothetical protein [Phycisphaeraceae bacterium]